MRRRKKALEREVANLANVVAQGDFSLALRAALVDREREITEITGKLLSAQPNSLEGRLRDIRTYVHAEMRNLREILNSDVASVRAKLAKHIEKITLIPTGEHYMASGTWNFLGRGSIGGAGGQNRTGYARLFRAALYQ
jgi:hypothetical protein